MIDKIVNSPNRELLLRLAGCSRLKCLDFRGTASLPNEELELVNHLKSDKILFERVVESAGAAAFIVETDDRVELFDVEGAMKESAKKAVAFVHKKFLDATSTHLTIGRAFSFTHVDENSPLCPCERFYGQPMLAKCTGVAISKNQIVTAGHCFPNPELIERYVAVYGIWHDSSFTLEVENAYELESIRYDAPNDVALVQTKTEIDDKYIAQISKSSVTEKQRIYSAGYPGPSRVTTTRFMGIPLKISKNGRVVTVNQLRANVFLDVFDGCSGGPVFDEETNQLIGIVLNNSATFHFREHPMCKSERGRSRFVSCYYEEEDGENVEILLLKDLNF